MPISLYLSDLAARFCIILTILYETFHLNSRILLRVGLESGVYVDVYGVYISVDIQWNFRHPTNNINVTTGRLAGRRVHCAILRIE